MPIEDKSQLQSINISYQTQNQKHWNTEKVILYSHLTLMTHDRFIVSVIGIEIKCVFSKIDRLLS
jgi:hypothetical protein